MKKNQIFKILTVMCFLANNIANAQFTSGNLTVFQAGDGSTSLVNTGNPIVLKEFSTLGAMTYSMVVPNTSTNALVVSGSATSEGFLSLSADGKYLVFAGYAQSLPNATSLAGASAATINRGIGMVGNAGLSSYSIVASSGSFFTSNNIRGAAAIDNNHCWGSGANQGTNYFGPASTPTNVQSTKVNLRSINIFNNQLYASSQVASGTPTDIGVYTIGTGTPITSGQTASCVIVTGASSQPAQFYFNNSGTICYVADQRNSALGGIQKWVYSANTWSLAYTLPTGTTAIGATGVVADFSGNVPIVYATTNESSSNRLIAVIDNGALSTATTLANANTASTVFRGLAFSPCAAPTLTLSSNTNFCADQSLSLTASATGGGPYSYTWTGIGVFSSTNVATPTVTGAATGIYTLFASNACGVNSETISVIVNPLPSISVNSITICTGQSATLTATGASTYLWSNNSSTSSIVVSPASNSNYTVVGTSTAGCVNSATTQVLVTTAPSITVNSPTICSGQNAILTANGVNTFTWSNGANTNSISVAPLANTVYTVTGSLVGCIGTSSNTATVYVNPSPTISISGNTITCSGSSVVLTASGATSYSWSNGSTTSSTTVTPTATTVYAVMGTNANNCSHSLTTTVTVTGAPILTVSATSTLICAGETVTLSVTGANTYSWSEGTTTSVSIVSPTSTTNYTVNGTIGANCSSAKQITINVNACTSLQSNKDTNLQMSIFPNPASEKIMLNFNNGESKTIRLIDLLGREVYASTTADKNVIINLSPSLKGIYFVVIDANNQRLNQKLMIE